MVLRMRIYLYWATLVWLTIAQGSRVNRVLQQQQQQQHGMHHMPRGYYRPPSARMISPEEATAQQGVQQATSDTTEPVGTAKPAQESGVSEEVSTTRAPADQSRASPPPRADRLSPTHTPQYQQRIAAPRYMSTQGIKEGEKEQAVDGYLRSLGINDPSVAALLSEKSVDDMTDSIEHSIHDAQHQCLRDGLATTWSTAHIDGKELEAEAEPDGPNHDEHEYDDTIHLDRAMSGADNNDDEPTYHVEPPDDPIDDIASTPLPEPITQWLEKFWEQRRAYKQSPTHPNTRSHQLARQHVSPAAQQRYGALQPHYGVSNQHPAQAHQRGSQINVYGQLHIHMSTPQSRQ